MQNNEQRETLVLQSPMLGTFGSKLTFTVGATYMAFGLIGFVTGIVKIKPPLVHFPNFYIKSSYYFNNMMSTGLRFANNAGGAAFLYSLCGLIITRVFEEEFGLMTNIKKNMLAGGMAGTLFKCTKGIQPAGLGFLTGAVIIGTMTFITDELREREITDFEMRFED